MEVIQPEKVISTDQLIGKNILKIMKRFLEKRNLPKQRKKINKCMNRLKRIWNRLDKSRWCFLKRFLRKKPKLILTPNKVQIYTDTVRLRTRSKNVIKTETKWLFRYKE